MYNKIEEKGEIFDILYQAYNLLRDNIIKESDFLDFYKKVIKAYEEHYENKKC